MYRVDIINRGESDFTVKSKDYEFIVDTKGKGITPSDTFLAGLGTCIGIYVRKFCRASRLELRGFRIIVEAEYNEEPPICFKVINVSLDLKGLGLDEQGKNVVLHFIEKCPIHTTLKTNPQINFNLI